MSNFRLENEKETFTQSLRALDHAMSDEELVDEGSLESKAALRASRKQQPHLGDVPLSSSNRNDTANRVNLNQLQTSSTTSLSSSNIKGSSKHSAMEKKTESSLRSSTSDITLSLQSSRNLTTALPPSRGKRKRTTVRPMVPEARQLFKGLSFYFFPNNAVNATRRMRIENAIEYGAFWIKEWALGVTHIIVDKGLTYAHLLAWLKLDSLPKEVIVVDELYPPDCLIYHTLLDPTRVQYKIAGYPDSDSKKSSTSLEGSSSQSSLQLKSGRMEALTPEPHTPFGAEGTKKFPQLTNQDRSEYQQPSSERFMSKLNHSEIFPTLDRQDSFDEIVQEARSLEHLPLDEEEDDVVAETAEEDDSDSQDSSSSPKPRQKLKQIGKSSGQNSFQCMNANDGKGAVENPNLHTIEILEQMGRYYDRMQDQWRTLAYRRAVSSLKREKRRITTKEEAVLLPFVGERLAAKIEEIVWTSRLRQLKNAQLDPADALLQKYLQIYGVGFGQASRWAQQGYKSLDDLLEKAALTENQRVGIAHYDDFISRIPRSDVTRHRDIVRTAIQTIDPDFEVIVGGSYRRGAASCGDIDCIITHPTHPLATIRTLVLDTLIPKLFAQGFLQVTLATTTSSSKTGRKWHGASKLPTHDTPLIGGRRKPMEAPWRRIDLLLVPPESRGAALIYFTGNDIFNRSLRLLASKKGMRLNQHGLFKDAMRGPGRARVTEGTLVEGRDEKRIFEVLDVPWREPDERIC